MSPVGPGSVMPDECNGEHAEALRGAHRQSNGARGAGQAAIPVPDEGRFTNRSWLEKDALSH